MEFYRFYFVRKCFLQKSYLGVELALTQYATGSSFLKLHFLVEFVATQLKVIKEFLVDAKADV